jgi:hypothetical protein
MHANILFRSPSIPNNGQFYIPIEVTSEADVKPLFAMQTALENFGFEEPLDKIASFIHTNSLFAAVLSSNIYPVLLPVDHLAIYQTWS